MDIYSPLIEWRGDQLRRLRGCVSAKTWLEHARDRRPRGATSTTSTAVRTHIMADMNIYIETAAQRLIISCAQSHGEIMPESSANSPPVRFTGQKAASLPAPVCTIGVSPIEASLP